MSFVVPAVLPKSRTDFDEKLALFASFQFVSRVQIDVVDGNFAAPSSWPFTEPAALGHISSRGELLPHLERIDYEIDLMCMDSLPQAELWLSLGATRFTFHAESVVHLPKFLRSARDWLSDAVPIGLALNVDSKLALIESCLDEITYVQFMGIAKIGRQGEPFDDRVLDKVRSFHHIHPDIAVQVDGGVSLDAAKRLLSAGATNVVVGSGILRAPNPTAALRAYENLTV